MQKFASVAFVFAMSLSAHAVEVQVKSGQAYPACLIEQKSKGDSGTFTIDCPPQTPGYKLTTLLAERAAFPDRVLNKKVDLYLSRTQLECNDPSSMMSAHRLSSNTPIIHEQKNSLTSWHYCFVAEGKINGVLTITVEPLYEYESVFVKHLDVHFEHDSDKLGEQSQQKISNFLAQVGELSKYRVEIHSHSSEIGEHVHNQRLSEKRGSAVKAFLLMKSPWTQTEISGQSFGEDKPSIIHPTAESHRWNRRVTILLIPKD